MPAFPRAWVFWVWDRLRTSFWFLPSGMVAAAVAASFTLIRVDAQNGSPEEYGILYTFGPEGARAVLSAIAGSMITIAGLTFSLTMLSLQLASSQYGPRLLRNIMQDRGNQLVLGIFIATFVYCLLVLRTVRGIEDNSFVPHLSVAFGVLLAIISLAVLIYFIHHVATAIRVENLLKQLTLEAISAIDAAYPENCSEERASTETDSARCAAFELAGQESLTVRSRESGYVESVDVASLIKIAEQNCAIAVVEARPGTFVVKGEKVLAIYGTERLSEESITRFQDAFVTGDERTPYEDVKFCLRRIVEVAQRVLSKGVNDPTTALYCIDRLREAFSHLAQRDPPAAYRRDQDGNPRVVIRGDSASALAVQTFAAVARYAQSDPEVIGHLVRTLDALRSQMGPEAQDDIGALARDIRQDCEAQLSAVDRHLLERNMFWQPTPRNERPPSRNKQWRD